MRISDEMFTNPHGGRISGSEAGCLQHPFEGKDAGGAGGLLHAATDRTAFYCLHPFRFHRWVGRYSSEPDTEPTRVPNLRHDSSKVCASIAYGINLLRCDRYVSVSGSEIRPGGLAKTSCARPLTQAGPPISARIANPTSSYGVLMGVHIAE